MLKKWQVLIKLDTEPKQEHLNTNWSLKTVKQK